MKKLVYILPFLIFSAFFAKAQTSLTQALDFTATDVNGVDHTLFDYLDDDKIVVIMFTTSTGWTTCEQAYPVLQDSYSHFGCHSGNTRFFLISVSHTLEQFQDPLFAELDMIKIPNPPGENIVSRYNITGYPTIILIKPDGVIAEQDIWPINVSNLRSKVVQHGGVPTECPVIPMVNLTLSANPTEGGSVSGGGEILAGNNVTVTADALQPYTFLNWTNNEGTILSTNATYSFAMPFEDLNLTANFTTLPTQTLTLTSNPEGAGVLSGHGVHFVSSTVEISAVANQDFAFVNWKDTNGNVIATNPTHTFPMPSTPLTLVAHFKVTTSVAEIEEKLQPVVFPNPTQDFVSLRLPNNLAEETFRIYDLAGKLWQRGIAQYKETKISLNGLPAGLYLLVFDNQEVTPVKIIKE